jgi:hypothetical protein
MTLREKFLPKMYCYFGSGMLTNSYDEKVAEDNAKECEQIAEEFAIGFASWFHKNYQNQGIQLYTRFGKWEKQTIEEAFEIYKKEKGL